MVQLWHGNFSQRKFVKALLLTMLFSGKVFAQTTVVDEILRDYRQSASFAQFLTRFQAKLLPGDDVFLYKKIQNAPELLKAKKIPSLTYENGTFTIRHVKAEYIFRLVDRDKFEFELNNQKLILHPSMIPSLRWSKISEMMVPRSSFLISFMPVAFAQQNGEATFSNIMLFSIISRLALEATHGLLIKTENSEITFLHMMKKVKEYHSYCSLGYLTQLMQKMASIQSSSFRCEASKRVTKDANAPGPLNGNVLFEIPSGDNTFRKIRLLRNQQLVEEEAPDHPGKKLIYRKGYSDIVVDFHEVDRSQKKLKRAIRQKGLQWSPVGKSTEEVKERAEQIRELVNFSYNTDLCNRCGLTFRRALKDLAVDLEMNPNLDQYGNEIVKDRAPKFEPKLDPKDIPFDPMKGVKK